MKMLRTRLRGTAPEPAPPPVPESTASQFEFAVDHCSVDAVIGWVLHPAGVSRVGVAVDGRAVGDAVHGLPRPDVARERGEDATASGFALAFGPDAFESEAGAATVSIEFEAADGSQATETRTILPLRAAAAAAPAGRDAIVLSPFPSDVVAVLRRLRPGLYGEKGPWPDATVAQALDDLAALLSQRAPVKPVTRYALFLSTMASTFGFIAEHFDRLNLLSDPAQKDSQAVASSPGEMLCIANHLYVLRSYGFEGNLAEFGCFKGFSSCCLSQACAALGLRFDMFDSFAGLPPSGSEVYDPGDFAGSVEEVTDNLRTFGRLDVSSLRKGFFSETVPGYEEAILSIWMDVDLLTSAEDVAPLVPRLPVESCVFLHECREDCFLDGRPVPESTEVLPPIVDAFSRNGREAAGRTLAGALGVVWDARRGIPVLHLDGIRRLTEAS